MKKLIFGLCVGGVIMFGAMKYHLLNTDQGYRLIPKRNATLAEAYLDVRQWGAAEWAQHPDLIWALSQSGDSNILRDSRAAEQTLRDELGRLLK